MESLDPVIGCPINLRARFRRIIDSIRTLLCHSGEEERTVVLREMARWRAGVKRDFCRCMIMVPPSWIRNKGFPSLQAPARGSSKVLDNVNMFRLY
jgi:hypothetical protein